MPRTKGIRIKEVKNLPNVFTSNNENVLNDLNNYWKNQNPVVLEIGCGHGDYSNALAKVYPDKNFIGIDIKGARIYTAAKRALNESLNNVSFFLGKAENLLNIFQLKSIERIIIPFPDPHIKRRSEKRRLISDEFFILYKKVLNKNGIVELKTDNLVIYEQALKTIKEFEGKIYLDVENVNLEDFKSDPDYVITKYEKHYLSEGRKIKFIRFGF